jgi:DNA-binding IclR family transcriptional regulator
MAKNAPEGAQAVIRAIRLLKALARNPSETTLAELCADLNLTRSTAHRLLSALESEGLVARNSATGAYRPGPGVIALGARALLANNLRDLVQPELEILASASGETATLEILADKRMLIVSEVSGRYLVTATAEVGTFWPLHATSSGKAVLALMPKEEQKKLLELPLERHTESTITGLGELERELQRTRKRGFAIAIEEFEAGAVAVAAALREPSGLPLAAISVSGPAGRLGRKRLTVLGRDLAATAERLSERFG